MNNSQVAHIWAQNDNKSASGSNFFCENNIIYSYGHHFPIATIKHLNNKGIVLFTNESYSNTTAKHINHVRTAINSDHDVLFVVDPLAKTKKEHIANYTNLLSDFERISKYEKRGRAGSNASRYRLYDMKKILDTMNRYTKIFKLGFRQKSTDEKTFLNLGAKLTEKREVQKRKLEKRVKIENEKRLNAEKIEREKSKLFVLKNLNNWINHKLDINSAHKFLSAVYKTNSVHCRISKNGENVQTSKGAEFPVKHAKRAWDIVSHCIMEKSDYKPLKRVNLGNFSIDHVTKHGTLKAGCHIVTFESMLPVALNLGFKIPLKNEV